MKLPAEIRNMIYTYALTDPSGVNLVGAFKHRRRTVERVSAKMASGLNNYHRPNRLLNDSFRSKFEDPVGLVPSLVAANKQTYQEGRAILYNNEFIFADTAALYGFMLNLSASGAHQLKHLRIKQWAYGRGMKGYNHACFAVLTQATNLKTLRLDKMSGWARKPQGAASKCYRDAFPWLEAVGAAKGRCDAGVDVLRLEPGFFDYGYRHGNTHRNLTDEEKTDEFLEELRKLLGAQQQRVMKPMVKKRMNAKSKVTEQQ